MTNDKMPGTRITDADDRWFSEMADSMADEFGNLARAVLEDLRRAGVDDAVVRRRDEWFKAIYQDMRELQEATEARLGRLREDAPPSR